MLYTVKLTNEEEVLLAEMLGQALELVTSDGWCIQLDTTGKSVRILPQEIATPDKLHPNADVERPQIQELTEASTLDRILEKNLGKVQEVNVITILISFSMPEFKAATTLMPGLELPAGIEYGYVYYQPSDLRTVGSIVGDEHALVELDKAIEIVTDKRSTVVLYTRGFFVLASLAGLPDEDWARIRKFTMRVIQ